MIAPIVLVVAACSPAPKDGQFSCADGLCPIGLVCGVDGRCGAPGPGRDASTPAEDAAADADELLDARDASLADARDVGPPLHDAHVEREEPCVARGPRDADRDGFCDPSPAMRDCNDQDPTISPGAAEVCTPSRTGSYGVDEDCDGAVDEGCPLHFGVFHPITRIHLGAFHHFRVELSADRLRLTFAAPSSGEPLWVAARPTRTAEFGTPEAVGAGTAGAIVHVASTTADELEVFVQAQLSTTVPTTLYTARRANRSDPFGPLETVPAAEAFGPNVDHVSVSRDGLELFAISPLDGAGRRRVLRAVRPDRAEPFRSFELVDLSASGIDQGAPGRPGIVDGPSLSGDGRSLFLRTPAGIERLVRPARGAPFVREALPPSLAVLRPFFVTLDEETREIFVSAAGPAAPAASWSPLPGDVYAIWRAEVCRDGPCAARTVTCPSEGRRFGDDLHCYVRVDAVAPWDAQRAACESMGMHLATIHSAAEHGAVRAILSADVAIGAREVPGSMPRRPEWITGEPFTFWPPGSIFDDFGPGEECFHLWGGGGYVFNDVACSSAYSALCERTLWPTW